MNFLSKVAEGHQAIKRGWRLMWQHKILFVYSVLMYSVFLVIGIQYAHCVSHKILHVPCCGKWCGIDMLRLVIAISFIIAYWLFAALINQVLSIVKNKKKSFTESFIFERTVFGQIVTLALVTLALFLANIYLLNTAFSIVMAIITHVSGLLSYFVLFVILDQSISLIGALKHAMRVLWAALISFIVLSVEMYFGLIAFACSLVFIVLAFLWMGFKLHFIHQPVWASVEAELVKQLWFLFTSPMVLMVVISALLLFLIAFAIIATLAVIVVTLLYYDTSRRLLSEQRPVTPPF